MKAPSLSRKWLIPLICVSLLALSTEPVLAGSPAPCEGPAVDLGFGKPGTGGLTPRFEVCGELTLGEHADFELIDALPDAMAFLIQSTTTAPHPFRGGILAPGLPFSGVMSFRLDGNGRYKNRGLGGVGAFTLTLQFVIIDPGAVGNLSFSNALEVTWES